MYTGEYSYDRGYVVMTATYLDPEKKILHGVRKRFYEDGTVEEKENFTNGLLDGVSKSYSQDGSVTDIRWTGL
jgi:antitoxin component YwqK of YwqJK toxin-antitoxin module